MKRFNFVTIQTYLKYAKKNKKNSNFFERILQIIDYYNIRSINSFALDYLNYNSSEKINRLKKDNTSPSYEIILDITNKFEDISVDWLITGKGNMLKDNYSNESNNYAIKVETGGIPLIPIDAMAGFGEGESSVLEYECERFVVPVFKDAEFLIAVRGSSMYPKYNSGDIVACKKLPLDTFFQWNRVYVLDTIQGALIKRVAKSDKEDCLLIISDNKSYAPFEIHKKDIRSLAIVIGVIRLE